MLLSGREGYVRASIGELTSKISKAGDFGTKETIQFSYSSTNQLVRIRRHVGTSLVFEAEYKYDPLGRRIEKRVRDMAALGDPSRTFTRRYVYEGANILLEYDGSNLFLARYAHSPGAVDDVLAIDVSAAGVAAGIAKSEAAGGYGEGTYFYLKDSLGSITGISNDEGDLIQGYIYSAYGRLLSIRDGSGTDISTSPNLRNSFTFTGREFDSETGLYYYRARYFDPESGRYLQTDPHPGFVGIPLSQINRYTYGANNPINTTDPFGESVWDVIEAILIIAAIIFVAIIIIEYLIPAVANELFGGAAVEGGELLLADASQVLGGQTVTDVGITLGSKKGAAVFALDGPGVLVGTIGNGIAVQAGMFGAPPGPSDFGMAPGSGDLGYTPLPFATSPGHLFPVAAPAGVDPFTGASSHVGFQLNYFDPEVLVCFGLALADGTLYGLGGAKMGAKYGGRAGPKGAAVGACVGGVCGFAYGATSAAIACDVTKSTLRTIFNQF